MSFEVCTDQHGVREVRHWRTLHELSVDLFNALHCNCVVVSVSEDGRRWPAARLAQFVGPIADMVAEHEAHDFTSVVLGPRGRR